MVFANRLQNLDLLIPDHVGRKTGRCFHGGDHQQLKQMVLEHIAQNTRFVVVSSASPHHHLFGNRDLNVIDVITIPDRFEDAVGETKHQHILNRFFPQVMVDSVNLILGKHPMQLGIQLLGRFKVGAKGLLNHKSSAIISQKRRLDTSV